MSAARPAEKQMIAYLLGELPEAESLRIEQLCIDDDFFEELLAVEAELTDACVQGQLAGGAREAIEKRLLNSRDGGKAIALSKLITRRDTSRSRVAATTQRKENPWSSLSWLSAPRQFLRFPLAVAAMLIIGISLGVLYRKQVTSRLHLPAAQLPQPATSAAKSTPSSQRPVVIATFVISAGGEREAGSVNEIRVPLGTDRLRLQVDLGNSDYKGYRAVLKMIDGKEVKDLNDLQASRSASGVTLFIQLAPSDLPPGDSMLTVSGLTGQPVTGEVVGRYFVRRLP
jgi:hypothetical protein